MTRKDLYPIGILSGVIISVLLVQSSSGASSAPSAPVTPVNSGEAASYDCARSLIGLVGSGEQPGPMFSSGALVFTSLETQDHQNILLVNAGHGNYLLRLEGSGVNRMRFEIPASENGPLKTFYLSYMHGGALRSRYFDYAENHAPPGHDELEYSLVHARRADNLIAHFDYAIHETAEAMLNSITEGHLQRSQISAHQVSSCDHIAQQSPAVARNLRHSLDEINMIVMGPQTTQPSTRSIASTGPATLLKK